MGPWDIIGWTLIAIVVAFVGMYLYFKIATKIIAKRLYKAQADFRKIPPKKHQIWISCIDGEEHYITGDDPIMVSTDANQMGGNVFVSFDQWKLYVERYKLINYQEAKRKKG